MKYTNFAFSPAYKAGLIPTEENIEHDCEGYIQMIGVGSKTKEVEGGFNACFESLE